MCDVCDKSLDGDLKRGVVGSADGLVGLSVGISGDQLKRSISMLASAAGHAAEPLPAFLGHKVAAPFAEIADNGWTATWVTRLARLVGHG